MAAFLSMRLLTASARAWRDDQAHRCSAAGKHILPGVLLCAVLAWVACLAHNAEEQLLGRVWLDRLVLAILTGAAVRTVWRPGERWAPGIAFAAKILLEVAVVLLGASLSGQALAAFG